MRLRIGTSGWMYPHWRGVFYPQAIPRAAWLQHYALAFDSVELHTTFYRLPAEAVWDGWRDQSPEGFRFAVKASRSITHFKKLKDARQAVRVFMARARRLEASLGPILWQLPPHWKANPERLDIFARWLPDDLIHIFEFRDADWFQPSIRAVLERHRLNFCIYDMVGQPCPAWVTGPVVYLRFHGSAVAYAGPYGRRRLEPWAARIRGWLGEGRGVWAYFNNDLGGHAVADARVMQDLLADQVRGG